MHVFIDTNILLKFYHFTSDQLDALNNVFASQERGAAIVHLTDQVCFEFRRNRESKINDAFKRFNEMKPAAQLPSFMQAYEEYEDIRQLTNTLKDRLRTISDRAKADIRSKNLQADHLMGQIIERSRITETPVEIYNQARMRVDIGNPPGKSGSIGDAINWLLLLESVPNGEHLHIISEDGDFYSAFDDKAISPFLKEEWEEKKRSNVRVYRTLTEFMREHFDGVALSFDPEKKEFIDALADSGSFATTHSLIASLNRYGYFSLEEVRAILDAANSNGQVGMIITDYDVSDFITKITRPHRANLDNPAHLEIIREVHEEQAQREREE